MISHRQLVQTLQRNFNFDHFRQGQEQVLMSLLHNQSTLAILPTGAGKTLIYQLYGLVTKTPILIVSPLLSLMTDQTARMQSLGIKRVIALNSLMQSDEQRLVLNHLDQYQFVYISPEMLSNPLVLQNVEKIHWGLLVIDEVHCISQWGHDFRPAYLKMKTIIEQLHHPLILMLTATASRYVQSDILKTLGLTNERVKRIVASVNRPNIFLAVNRVADEQVKQQRLIELVQQLKSPGIIYFSSKKLANQMSLILRQKAHVQIAAYHSGLSPDDKYKIQHQFMNGELEVICATSAFGMGIDKNNVRYIIHYHMPLDLESYVQEIGRAGRDGKQSVAILLYRPGDEELPKLFAQQNIANADEIRFAYAHPQIFKNRDVDDNEKLRILKYYFENGTDMQQIKRDFMTLMKRRSFNLRAMEQYIQTNRCRRHLLLKYFSADQVEHDERCCNGLETSLSLPKLGLYSPHSPTVNPALNWRNTLDRLFNSKWKN